MATKCGKLLQSLREHAGLSRAAFEMKFRPKDAYWISDNLKNLETKIAFREKHLRSLVAIGLIKDESDEYAQFVEAMAEDIKDRLEGNTQVSDDLPPRDAGKGLDSQAMLDLYDLYAENKNLKAQLEDMRSEYKFVLKNLSGYKDLEAEIRKFSSEGEHLSHQGTVQALEEYDKRSGSLMDYASQLAGVSLKGDYHDLTIADRLAFLYATVAGLYNYFRASIPDLMRVEGIKEMGKGPVDTYGDVRSPGAITNLREWSGRMIESYQELTIGDFAKMVNFANSELQEIIKKFFSENDDFKGSYDFPLLKFESAARATNDLGMNKESAVDRQHEPRIFSVLASLVHLTRILPRLGDINNKVKWAKENPTELIPRYSDLFKNNVDWNRRPKLPPLPELRPPRNPDIIGSATDSEE